METNESPQQNATPVERDSEQPLLKKPSVLYLTSLAIGIITFVVLAYVGYRGNVG